MLTMFLLTVAQLTNAFDANAAGNLTQDLYWASADASGSRLCDRRLGARYHAQFELRYGERIRILTTYHLKRFGPDSDFIIVSDCRASTASIQEQDREHAAALNHFDSKLRHLELRYGPDDKEP